MALPKLKIPGEESTTEPPIGSPNVQTAPDIKTSQAVAGISPISTPTVKSEPGGTAAPNPVTGGGNTVPNQNNAPATSAQGPTVSSQVSGVTGIPNTSQTVPGNVVAAPPPGTPTFAPTTPIAPTPKSIEGKGANETELINAENKRNRELYEAALGYEGPEGALGKDQQSAIEGLRGATNNRGAAGTINSSLFGDDKSRIVAAKNKADAIAHDTYNKAVADASEKFNEAQAAYRRADAREKREIEEAARKRQNEDAEAAARTAAAQAQAAPAPSYPTLPAQAASTAPAGPGGVVPYTSQQQGGWVSVGKPLKKW